MKREFLTELGLEGEQVDAIMKEHGKSVNALKEDAEQVETLQEQIDDYKKQLKDRDTQLKELEKNAKGNEDLENRIQELQDENEQAQKDYEQKLADTRKRSKLELAIKDANAHDPDDVISKLDLETVKLDGDKLLGFEEQLNSIKENKPYLFKSEDEPKLKGRDPHPSDPNKPKGEKNPFSKDTFNLTEAGQLVRNDPEKARQLISQAGGNPANYDL